MRARKLAWDINRKTIHLTSKVNHKDYLTNRLEPTEVISDIKSAISDSESGMVKDAYPQKRVLRSLASRLRFGDGI